MFLCFNDCYAKICIKRTCKYYIPFCTYEHCEWARCVDSQPGWSGPVTMVTMWVTCVWSPLTWYTVVIGLQGTSLQPAAVPGILGSEVQRARVGSCWSHWTMTDPVCGEATLPAASLHRGWVKAPRLWRSGRMVTMEAASIIVLTSFRAGDAAGRERQQIRGVFSYRGYPEKRALSAMRKHGG